VESECEMRMVHPMIGTALGVAVLALSACAGGNAPGVASLHNQGAQPSANPSASGSAEDQALAFAQCMRDNGVNFPDPTVNADGSPSFAGAFDRSQSGGFDPSDTSFRTAMEACRPLMSGAIFAGGPGGPGGNFDPTAIQDALLPYTACLRQQGLDVGDLTLQRPTGTTTGTGTPDAAPSTGTGAPPRGETGGGFNRSDMFARMLGQDPTDPAWIAANAACENLLTDAFQGRGGTTTGGTTTGGEG